MRGAGGIGDAGRPGGKAFSKSPEGRKVDGRITLFYKAQSVRADAYVYVCSSIHIYRDR